MMSSEVPCGRGLRNATIRRGLLSTDDVWFFMIIVPRRIDHRRSIDETPLAAYRILA